MKDLCGFQPELLLVLTLHCSCWTCFCSDVSQMHLRDPSGFPIIPKKKKKKQVMVLFRTTQTILLTSTKARLMSSSWVEVTCKQQSPARKCCNYTSGDKCNRSLSARGQLSRNRLLHLIISCSERITGRKKKEKHLLFIYDDYTSNTEQPITINPEFLRRCSLRVSQLR